ncbi:MAG: glycoside hydrolase family 97 catalytic domain-containing protein [Bacteroidota bacterium]|nr:glycoside hydrolase family 97 catalytic domain-containing protein [Bacteroidota bacterium]
MNRLFITAITMLAVLSGCSTSKTVNMTSPDGRIKVAFVLDKAGQPAYSVQYLDTAVITNSTLGLKRKDADFTTSLRLDSVTGPEAVNESYTLLYGKKREAVYNALRHTVHLSGSSGEPVDIIFQVSDEGFAFCYRFPGASQEVKFITEERSSFGFAEGALAWIQPRAASKSGWNQTNPSYEENYLMEVPLATVAADTNGWVFPALFRSGNCWVNLTESWPDRSYCGSHLAKGNGDNEMRIAFPELTEGYTGGSVLPQSGIPWQTPWRIVTMGSTPGVIAESTHGTDLAAPPAGGDFSYVRPGRAAWSWALMKDRSVNFEVQKRFISYASEMGWEYCLIDVNWDKTIGWEKIAELARLAEEKKVGLILWYNSAGDWNTVTYHPKDRLLTHELREEEFSRLESIGIKGIKVDFFGGDGQSMMDYYQDILADAHRHKLVVNCHGSTYPRGLQRTWPNLVSMEAIRGFEFATFDQATADLVASKATILAFTRNAFDPMDFTPVCFTRYDNFERRTGNGAELALAVLFLSGVQHYAETPMGMATVPDYVKEMMMQIPVSWDETRFIDGYPGRYIVMARRTGDNWYIAGVNAEKEQLKLAVRLPFPVAGPGTLITEGETLRSFSAATVTPDAEGKTDIEIQPSGGFVIKF